MRHRLLLAALLIPGIAAVSSARAEDDRMVGRMDHDKPRAERSADDEESASTYNNFESADDRSAGTNPVDKPKSFRERRRERREAARDLGEQGEESPAPRNAAVEDENNEDSPARDVTAISNEPPPGYTVDTGPQAVNPDEIKSVDATLPPVKSIPVRELEVYGLYDTADAQSLGIDMWIGSGRDYVSKMLPQIPPQTRYRTLRDLTERMLLTQTDAQMLGGGAPAPGEDLMTLRLEKLIETGAYSDAAKLYAVNAGSPYHERLARAGVTAMLYSGESALGCLEVKSLAPGYKDQSFWTQLNAICDLYLSKDLAKSQQITLPEHVFDNSPLLQKLADKPGFMIRPSDMDELAALSAAERIAMFTLHRVDYSKLVKLSFADLVKTEPALLSAMLSDTALPARLRMYATLAAVSMGSADISTLTSFYESGDVPGIAGDAKSWKQLIHLYRTAKNLSPGSARDSLLVNALNLRKTYGTASLLPFAPMLADSDPANMTPESMAAALAVMVKAGQDIPDKWKSLGLAILSPGKQASDTALSFIAYDISQGFKPLNSLEPTEFQGVLEKVDPAAAEIVRVVYEKLDKGSKLHNIVPEKAYEKEDGLTPPVDYVMPLSNLLSELELAKKDKRLGEVILISSVLLRSSAPGKIAPEVLGEVLDGYKTVGLTREARELSAEVVLGLRK
jgi:hypothetical protein